MIRNRRFILTNATGFTAVGILGSGAAIAQTEVRQQAVEAFGSANQALLNAEYLIARASVDPDAELPTGDIRGLLVDSVSTIAGVVDSAETGLEVCRVEHLLEFQQASSEQVNIRPDPESIQNQSEWPDESDGESFSDIIAVILLDAVGIDPSEGNILRQVLESVGLIGAVRELALAISNRNWTAVVRLIEFIVSVLFGPAGRAAMIEIAGSEFGQRIIRAVMARAVPFLGWSVFAIQLGLSIYEHWDRLMRAIDNDPDVR